MNGRLLLVGCAALTLGAGADEAKLREYVARFNADDEELYTNAVPNAAVADFLAQNVPLFECPDKSIERTYHFRWWTYRKHLKKTPSGWVVTEFLPDVGWAGKYNTISCPLGHHLREGRWLRSAAFLDDFTRFMLTEGSVNGPRAYACWPAWATCERAKVTGDMSYGVKLLPLFVKNWETWEKGWPTSHKDIVAGYKPARGLFDFIGDREGTECALSVDGARPMINAAMWAEASSIAALAREAGRHDLAKRFAAKAAVLEQGIKTRLWHPGREFFTAVSTNGGHDDVCELHGYAPFYFRMPLAGFEKAWQPLMDDRGFWAAVGLTFPRRDTPGFNVKIDYTKHECLWDGPSWPYATSVTLTALYETLQDGAKIPVKSADFAKLLKQYADQHVRVREDGKTVPWIDENLHPDRPEWISRRIILETPSKRGKFPKERGKDYNHSTFCDLVISGLVGFQPDGAKGFAVDPLFPETWNCLVLENLRYRGHDVDIRWRRGSGLTVTVDGREAARRETLGKLTVALGK